MSNDGEPELELVFGNSEIAGGERGSSSESPGGVATYQDTGNLVTDLITRLRVIVLSPKVYFSTFSLDEPVAKPAIFYLATMAPSLVITSIFGFMHPSSIVYNMVLLAFSQVWLIAICALLRFTSGLFGGTGNLPAMIRAVVYANAPNILSCIPIISFFAWLYSLCLAKLAVERVEGLEAPRSTFAVGIVAGVSLLVNLGIALVATALFIAKSAAGGK